MNASSSGTRRQLSGTMTAPSLAIAKKLSMNSTLFISSSADAVALAHTQRAEQRVAVRLARAFSSANVKRRPVSASTMASRSGLSWARLATKCPMFVDVFVICR